MTDFSWFNLSVIPFSGDDINTGYAVYTDQSGTTTILRYLKDGDGNFNLNETAPNPFLVWKSKSANSIPRNEVGTGDVPNPFPVGVYHKSDGGFIC